MQPLERAELHTWQQIKVTFSEMHSHIITILRLDLLILQASFFHKFVQIIYDVLENNPDRPIAILLKHSF